MLGVLCNAEYEVWCQTSLVLGSLLNVSLIRYSLSPESVSTCVKCVDLLAPISSSCCEDKNS